VERPGHGWRRGERIQSKTVVNGTGRAETPRGATRRLASRIMGSSAKDLTSGTSEGAVSATSGTAEDRSRGGGVVAAYAATTSVIGESTTKPVCATASDGDDGASRWKGRALAEREAKPPERPVGQCRPWSAQQG
jgi:hypothetical protein